MEIEDIKFHLDSFEGPLDLLLHLIAKNKVNIYDIPISLIFSQYMEYINSWRSMDMDIAGEFIAMASELMLIKSRMLLPKLVNEPQEDPRERLAAALIEYKKAKETAAALCERYKQFHGRIVKEPEEISPDIELTQHNVRMLTDAFERIMRRSRANGELTAALPPEKTLGSLLSYRTVSLPGKIIGIMKHLYIHGDDSFENVLMLSKTRGELITSFVAILELMRAQRIMIAEDCPDTLGITLRLDRINHRKTSYAEMSEY